MDIKTRYIEKFNGDIGFMSRYESRIMDEMTTSDRDKYEFYSIRLAILNLIMSTCPLLYDDDTWVDLDEEDVF